VAILLVCGACGNSGLPQPGSQKYADLCSAFYLGLAGLQSGEDVRAKEYLTRSTQIAPGEPAGWADLGILQVRQQQFDGAYQSIDKARSLAPSNSRIEALLGLVESRRGKLAEADAHLKKAISLDGRNLQAIYSLAAETERDGGAENLATAQELLERLLQAQPRNAAVLLDDLRLAAKRGDKAEAQRSIAALKPLQSDWPDVARQQFTNVENAVNAPNLRPAAVQVQFLRNILMRVPAYRASLDQVQIPATLVARPFTHFLRLPSPNSQPGAPDTRTQFSAEGAPHVDAAKVSWLGSLFLDDTGARTMAWTDDAAFHLSSGASLPLPGKSATGFKRTSIAAADLNYDFKTDISIATPYGLKIYRQQDSGHFLDVTPQSKIPAAVASGSYKGVWAFDVDLDGDLDLVLGRPHGEPVVLRNNGDGSFTVTNPFKGMDGLTAFTAADIDGDGTPDVAMVDAQGNLHVFLNERLGSYRVLDTPAAISTGVQAIASGDIDGDGTLDLVLLKSDSSVVRLSQKRESTEWGSAVLLHATGHALSNIFLADIDNNGALDIVANNQVFLSDGKSFTALKNHLSATPQDVSDMNTDGKLDILAIDQDGKPVALVNHGSKNYHWQEIRTRAAHAVGDQRINSFGIGGEIEVRSDLLAQKQVINAPVLHFGLGKHADIQFARIVWPNGFVQAEFDLKADQSVLAAQRMKGSCPMLFSWDGKGMQFVKDVGPWGAALGLNVNAQGKGIYGTTREWFNIRSDQMAPHNGFYDLRITSEYWETYYIDHYSLLVVDHPAGSDVLTDERFVLPPPAPKLFAMTDTKPFLKAVDDNGNDVTSVVHDLDRNFLDTFGRGQYQGVTRDHWVELELPPDAPRKRPLYLVGQGWIHPTDATIVLAQAQNSKVHPHGLSIEVPDASGHWTTVRDDLGFPEGRVKTIVLDISNIFRPGAPRKLRLRTNLELYWDKLSWGTGLPSSEGIHVKHLDLAAADLRYRGFSLITQANPSSPEVPHYDVVQESVLRWDDQEGYATRYGDVRELLANVDDRYVITSPGDELRLKFPVLPPPAAGLRRDFVLICDGWVKDGDYSTRFSKTIRPLPYHGMKDYLLPPTTLEQDHAYQLHPDDWRTYHTRYVTPQYFESALWSGR